MRACRKDWEHGIWPPLITSTLFGVVGIYTVVATAQFAGNGMCLVSLTSLLFHSTYTTWTRRIDLSSNVLAVAYFSIFDWRWYYWGAVPALIGGYLCTVMAGDR